MSLSRRDFLVSVPSVGAALAFAPVVQIGTGGPGAEGALPAARRLRASSNPSPSPIVSFHLDQPYLDLTGLEKPYVPPAGLRSGAPLAALSQEEILSRYYGFI
jgi:hypothetical protein